MADEYWRLPYTAAQLQGAATNQVPKIDENNGHWLVWDIISSAWVDTGIMAGGGIVSFNGRTGAVVPQSGDYSSFYAPSGCGSEGETLTEIVAASAAETAATYGARIDAFLATIPLASTQIIHTAARGYCPELYGSGQYLIDIFSGGLANVAVKFSTALGYTGGIMRKINGTWQPFEWFNPPLVAGQEYRTTERWNSKPVYVKAVSVTSIPTAGGYTATPHGITNLGTVLSCTGTISGKVGNASFTFASPYITPTDFFSLSLYSNAQGIVFYSSAQSGNVTLTGATAILKYTKSTD